MRYYLNPKLSKNPSVTMVVRMPKSLCVCDVAGAGRSGIHCPRKGIGMGEKVYKPILGEEEHLLSSTDNPGRVRGCLVMRIIKIQVFLNLKNTILTIFEMTLMHKWMTILPGKLANFSQ